ncbi:MAG: hypothetical protein ACI8PB_000426 [Desulforhopalus sp.]|jgi:hypothetical protein
MINLNDNRNSTRPVEPSMDKRINKYPVHWTSKMLMPLPDDIFTGLLRDIEEEGQLEPAILWEDPKAGKEYIIDGNHRQQVANILGKKLKVTHLTKATKEEQLPFKVLSKQFHRRGRDKVYCCCEALDAIETMKSMNIKKSIASMVKRYPDHLNRQIMSYLNTIKKLRLPWFISLKHGHKVDTKLGYKSNSPQTLAQLCKEEEKKASTPDVEQEISEGDQGGFTEIARKTLCPMIKTVIDVTSPTAVKHFQIH